MKTANKTNRYGGETAAEPGAPRALFVDFECFPNLATIWGRYEQDALEIIKERRIVSVAWNWLGEDEIPCLALPDFASYKKNPDDNYKLMERVHGLYSSADIVIGHNLRRFDDRRANTDFIKHGFPPPPPHKVIDTLEIARDKFDFNSNRLDDLGAFLDLGRKVSHRGYDLWRDCMAGDCKAWGEMRQYNIGDVALLKKIYYKFRPWIANHPSMVILDSKDGCPACRSRNMKRKGFAFTQRAKRQRFVCGDCGKWCSGVYKLNGWAFF